MLGIPSQAATSGRRTRAHPLAHRAAASRTDRTPGTIDARQLSGTRARQGQPRGGDRPEQGRQRATSRSLGAQARRRHRPPDRHTPRDLGRLERLPERALRGAGPHRRARTTSARTSPRSACTAADLATLRFRQDYVDPIGVHNLSWTQSVAGAHRLRQRPAGAASPATAACCPSRAARSPASPGSPPARPTATAMSATPARSAAARNVGGARRRRRGRLVAGRSRRPRPCGRTTTTPQRVWFLTAAGLRPGWSTYVQTSDAAPTSTSSTPPAARRSTGTRTPTAPTVTPTSTTTTRAPPKGGKPQGRQLHQAGLADQEERPRSSRVNTSSRGPT